ncbi:cell division protein FtsQ [Phormidesmis priestleyi ULC007]|uniref:Cell division protein FtsQ n=1 Tax=Phormidesmis priestleyi ULC007 TaxID=1920490 RepID=A0A2T1DML7_9CYAN|nr:FtsQ-type POTRA domain-containing protein [Phormidesmis priestleyi]PSB21664.1 cell division protein FtsQ [Phormidesmis priestleyi ULC007]PZO50787.1 MAG: cell division protein FtsQ [Phormidesmis priestleyi]
MTSIAPISQTELTQRRQKLRRQRRVRFFQTSWRSLAVTGLAGGAVWVATLPAWVIRKPEQVTIKGNQFISAQTIRTLLPIAYPQSLLKIQPQALADALKSKAPISEATVDRQLFPPGLTVRVRERNPVAIAQPSSRVSISSPPTASKGGQPAQASDLQANPTQSGLLDENGIWTSLETYTALNQSFKLPTLKVTGNLSQYRPNWTTLYQMLSRSPVKVSEINWEDPNNLILKTEIGSVHFGMYGSNFANQLKALDQMRRLPNHVNPSQLSYIDLRNPDSPFLQMNPSKTPVKLSTP